VRLRSSRAPPVHRMTLYEAYVMSGDSRVETLLRSMGVGAAAFVVKPFTRESLTSKLEKVLKG
jgi:DNA-binding NtrC family response regulator